MPSSGSALYLKAGFTGAKLPSTSLDIQPAFTPPYKPLQFMGAGAAYERPRYMPSAAAGPAERSAAPIATTPVTTAMLFMLRHSSLTYGGKPHCRCNLDLWTQPGCLRFATAVTFLGPRVCTSCNAHNPRRVVSKKTK